MVDGDHRVAIVANREMREGEELFYNYHYDKRVSCWVGLTAMSCSGLEVQAGSRSGCSSRYGHRCYCISHPAVRLRGWLL